MGLGKRAIEVRLERAWLHPIGRGVYAVGHSAIGMKGRWMAAVLAGGDGAVLSHRSAGQLWRLLPRSAAYLPEVVRSGGWRSRPGLVAHRLELQPDEISVVDGIPVTSVPRTLLDLASLLDRRGLEKALNEAEVRELTDRLSIPDLLERYPRRRGSTALRALLGDDSTIRGVTREALEERFVAFVDDHGLPRPRLNAAIAAGGRFFQADCLWGEAKLIVELDGRAAHGTPRAFESDRERDRLLLVDGWSVMRVTWRQLRDDAAEIAADLRKLLEAPSL